MKTSAVLASLLFGSFAVAAPVDRRALVYKTEIVTETVIVYTTIYDDEPVPEATTTGDALYEHRKPATTAVVELSSSAAPKISAVPTPAPTNATVPAYTASAPAEEPSSVFTPPPAPETPEPTPEPTPESTPEPQPEAPKPTTEEAPAPAPTSAAPTTTQEAPAPASTSAAPHSYSAAPASDNGGGMQYTNVDMTIYDNNGGFGACGTALHDEDMIVALAQPAWGASTYDTMTGEATNPWCGQKIKVEYQGNSIEATIMDLCPGCSGNDIDLSLAAWKALTGLDEKTRLKASWSKIN